MARDMEEGGARVKLGAAQDAALVPDIDVGPVHVEGSTVTMCFTIPPWLAQHFADEGLLDLSDLPE